MIFHAIFIDIVYFFLYTMGECPFKQEKYVSGGNKNVTEALHFLQDHDRLALENGNKLFLAMWNYQSILTEKNKESMVTLHIQH